ncbi:MAG: hypothetical protein IPM23_04990 [Candidatus Melainabacteria bacterium]|nr:hypothetical protein [Candidatus Melainabacteria bacterium]
MSESAHGACNENSQISDNRSITSGQQTNDSAPMESTARVAWECQDGVCSLKWKPSRKSN